MWALERSALDLGNVINVSMNRALFAVAHDNYLMGFGHVQKTLNRRVIKCVGVLGFFFYKELRWHLFSCPRYFAL